jgi:hypothetical protein
MEIVIANFDDWKGIYVDGELLYENHDIPYKEIFYAIEMEFEDLEVDMMELDIGRLPDTLKELRELMERTDE